MLGYPDWATEKQLEGMRQFQAAFIDYGYLFDISFKGGRYGVDSFCVVLTWSSKSGAKLTRTFHLAVDYVQTWNCFGVELHDWQLIFSSGDDTAEVSAEIILADLCQYLIEGM